MLLSDFKLQKPSILILTLLLAACGGSGGSSNTSSSSISPPAAVSNAVASGDTNVPQATGNTAADGFNWFNYRRQQLGLRQLTHHAAVDQAAQAHSTYQQQNDLISHDETPGKPGFTGITLADRLTAAGYRFGRTYAYGEVIASSGTTSGVSAAEDLIAAIYHRFVIFEPVFRQAGAGAATVTNGNTYFTVDFITDAFDGLGQGKFVHYPVDGQQGVPINFFSDYETPDPVPNRNEVGYPVSIHADLGSTINVESFTIQPRGGAAMSARLLTKATDQNTSTSSAVAIVPLSRLARLTTYDVSFSGSVDGVAVSRNWSFTTE
ncbi:MAG: hypothetical protein K0S28_277 [Paucimonas sp.]|jgi:uncharacterized protein YkwD|nr:hypothetical protein [Paucimonas sp.]